MNHKERRQLENVLLVAGLARLDDPELIQQLADLVSDWRGDKHQFLQDLINECDPDQRSEMYSAIAPKLRFKALPLPTIECRIAEQAGAMVSRKQMRVEGSAPRPIQIGDHQIEITAQAGNCGWAAVRCHQCGKLEKFLSDTPIGAMIAARKAGWVRDISADLEQCPECRATGQEIGHA